MSSLSSVAVLDVSEPAEHFERHDVEVALPRAAAHASTTDRVRCSVWARAVKAGMSMRGVAVADEEDVGAGAVHEGAVGGGLAVAVREVG